MKPPGIPADDRLIILLDLNYTLIENSPPRGSTPPRMVNRLRSEKYRQWLVELVRPHTVILITARPETWMIRTLDRIEEETGWRPDNACFAPKGWWNPPAIKEHLLKKRIFPVHGADAPYIAIESNPRTRKMYARYEIPCFLVTEEGTCLTEDMMCILRHQIPFIRHTSIDAVPPENTSTPRSSAGG